MIGAFSGWLSQTALSLVIQEAPWIIPSIQSVHILALSMALSCAVMLDLRLLGLVGSDSDRMASTARFLPWIWGALAVLALSGTLLVIGEPHRTLPNPVFQAKMAMLAAVLVVTPARQRTLTVDANSRLLVPARRLAMHAMTILSLVTWVAIVCAGRWIAYVNV